LFMILKNNHKCNTRSIIKKINYEGLKKIEIVFKTMKHNFEVNQII
jgi:hypothetical protein